MSCLAKNLARDRRDFGHAPLDLACGRRDGIAALLRQLPRELLMRLRVCVEGKGEVRECW